MSNQYTTGRTKARNFAERFWEKVDRTGDCWIWKAALHPFGYGVFSHKPHRSMQAHRVVWQITRGPIPKGLCVFHKCDNPSCVNPCHLFLGTHADNVKDMIRKKRNAKGKALKHNQKGEFNNRAKLTQKDVDEIRLSKERPTVLAKKYKVTYKNIWKIRSGNGWCHEE